MGHGSLHIFARPEFRYAIYRTLKINKTEFICSSPSLKFCPRGNLPEFAFIGRSNVGKSSLINMLTGTKGLAKISSTPGKTRLINHFKVESECGPTGFDHADLETTGSSRNDLPVKFIWHLVDLPGYGFAKITRTEREKFEGMIRNFLEKRENLALTFLLIDSRLDPQKIDVEFINWLIQRNIAFLILFTKTDKLSKNQIKHKLDAYQRTLSMTWESVPDIIPVSSVTRTGKAEVLQVIREVLLDIS